MNKVVKIILSIISSIIIFLVMIPIALGIMLQIRPIQNIAVDYLSEFLSAKAGTTISVGKVGLDFFNRAALDDVYMADMRGDTMIYVQKMMVNVTSINFLNGKVNMGSVTLENGKCYLYRDSLGVMNVQEAFAGFRSNDSTPSTGNLRLEASQLNLINFQFKLRYFDAPVKNYGVNYRDMDVRNIYMQARNVKVLNYDIRFVMSHLSFMERSGFYLQHLDSHAVHVDGKGLRFSDLTLQTPESDIRCPRVFMLYDSWWAYTDFVNDVRLDVELGHSRVSYKTISYFVGQKTDIPTSIELRGVVRGPVSMMEGSLRSVRTYDTDLSCDFLIEGLPKVNDTHFKIDVLSLTTNGLDVQRVYNEVTDRSLDKISGILGRSGNVSVSGSFEGLLHDFHSDAVISMRQGTVRGDLRFINPIDTASQVSGKGGGRVTHFTGNMSTENFNVGDLMAIKGLGTITVGGSVDATIRNGMMGLTTDASIANFNWKGYRYRNVDMKGRFEGRRFEGAIRCNDPNLKFDTSGEFDFSGAVPAYNFEMALREANLVALGINRRDSVSMLSAHFSAHAVGSTLDNVNGEATFDSILYINYIDTVHTGAIYIKSVNDSLSKSVSITSDFLDLELKGRNSYANMWRYIVKSVKRYIPSLPQYSTSDNLLGELGLSGSSNKVKGVQPKEEKPYDDGFYMLRINVKKANNVAGIFMPGLNVASGTQFTFYFNPYLDQFNVNCTSDYIERKDFLVEKLTLSSRNQQDSVSVFLSADYLGYGNIDLPNFSIIGGVKDNVIALDFKFNDREQQSGGFLQTVTTFRRTDYGLPQVELHLLPSVVRVKGNSWNFADCSVVADSTGIDIKGFSLADKSQRLDVYGRVARRMTDTLTVKVSNFSISPLSALVSSLGYDLTGAVGGTAYGIGLLGKNMQVEANLDFQDVAMSGHPLGDARLVSDFDKQNRNIRFALYTPDGLVPARGAFDVAKKRYNMDFKFDSLSLVLLEPMLKGILVNTSGYAAAKVNLSGSGSKARLNGRVDVLNYNAQVGFTKARYSLAGPITIVNNRFELKPIPITDNAHGRGTVSAYFDSDYFKNLRFGVTANFQNMLALNTTANDSELFYGKAYATGLFNVSGVGTSVKMNIVAQTAENSSFILPLSNVASISEADFINFVQPRDSMAIDASMSRRNIREITKHKQIKAASELNIQMDLSVLPNTQAQIVIDPQTGSSVEGRGTGRLMMNIDPGKDIFTLRGPFDVEKGSYRFVLPELAIDKRFAIENGKLLWSGDPVNPYINVDAVYKLKASMATLTGSQGGANAMATVDCGINLNGNMLNPNIRLSITAPSADPETQNALSNLLNTEESTMTQFLSLLLNRSFLPDFNSANSIGTMTGSLVGVTISEFLSNQISNLVSSDKFNFRIGYRPSDNITYGDEVNFEVGSELIKNVLSVEVGGNYNTGNNPTTTGRNPFSGDANLTWTINKAGTLKLKGFTRVIDRFDETQGLQESGVGVYFRQDFQNFKDLQRRYNRWRADVRERRADKEEQKRQSSKTSPSTGGGGGVDAVGAVSMDSIVDPADVEQYDD